MSALARRDGWLEKADSRRTSRELAQLEGRGRLEMARINQEADLQAERISALAYVGKRAMHEVTLLSQLEHQLCTLVPLALPRLQGIGDITALAMADVVADTAKKVK